MKMRCIVNIILCLVLILKFVNAQELLPKGNGILLSRKEIRISYNENHEQAEWVYYVLTPEFVNGKAKRRNDFRADPDVKTGSASLADYRGSGYDRGHLCPAAAMKLNAKAMSETFFMSNMSPQKPYFNRGIWKNLEAQVRSWVRIEKKLYVVTGPVFKDNLGTIGKNKVTVPGYYYKVIYDPTGTKKMIGFIMRNEKSGRAIKSFAVSVDEVEKVTGIDFFPGLEDKLEERLEGRVDVSKWNWKH